VSAQDAKKIKPGMFLANGNAPGVYFPDDKIYGAYSQVYISSITTGTNGRMKVNLSSPKYTPPGSLEYNNNGYIQGAGAAAANLNTIVFSNTKIKSLATLVPLRSMLTTS
jgi:hypothetical protein